jgi:hypothetical protein
MIAAPPTARTYLPASPLAAARLSFAAAGLFLFLLATLHVVRPDVDPDWTVISAYALGEHGWMMSAAFASLGLAYASLVAAVWSHAHTRTGRLGLALLISCAVGLAMAAIFPTDPITATADQATAQGHLHGAGAALAGLTPLAAILVTWGLSRNPEWSAIRRSLWVATAIAWLGEGVFIASLAAMVPADGRLGPDVFIGWPNRLMIVTYCVWLMVIARRAAARSSERAP